MSASAFSSGDSATRRLAAIVESSDDAIVSKDLNGIVTSWNRAAERIFGYTAAEMVGRSIRTIIPADRQSEEDVVLAKIRRGEKVEHFETIRCHKSGKRIPISLTVSPIRDEDGTVIGASKIARDVSDRVEADAERARLFTIAERNAATAETLNHVGTIVASALDRSTIAQAVIDAGTAVTGAAFGVFSYNVIDREGAVVTLCATSRLGRESFASFALASTPSALDEAFRDASTVRLDDIAGDGRDAPLTAMLPRDISVRSYLAAVVRTRGGEAIGGLFFGHPYAAVFAPHDEQLAAGIAAWAAVALENARLYDRVQETNRLKDEFLATFSHELRTPLNAILGYARMMRSGIVAGEKQRKAVETIERNATSLTEIVEDVLDVSRIVSGKMRLSVKPTELADVVRRAVDGVMPAASAKSIAIDLSIEPGAGLVSGDAERLQQVVWNLLTNAVKFTGRGGRIRVRLERVASSVEITVSDTGIGIAPGFLPYIFDRFRQFDATTTRERGGLGLGLGIARQLVEMHGGTIAASSEGLDRGSTFTVRLPVMAVRPAAASSASAPTAEQADALQLQIPDLTGVRALVVDDDHDALGMVREILEAMHANVSVADSAAAALEALPLVRPDVLVSDLAMPRMDGFELIAQVRGHPDESLRNVPAAALTAYARSEDRTRALESGFQMHLAKPIDPAELMDAVAALVRSVPRDGHLERLGAPDST
jgi:PAS domain S-box-containing protein